MNGITSLQQIFLQCVSHIANSACCFWEKLLRYSFVSNLLQFAHFSDLSFFYIFLQFSQKLFMLQRLKISYIKVYDKSFIIRDCKSLYHEYFLIKVKKSAKNRSRLQRNPKEAIAWQCSPKMTSQLVNRFRNVWVKMQMFQNDVQLIQDTTKSFGC